MIEAVLARLGAVVIGAAAARFPPLLREIATPPQNLYVQGDPALLARAAVAVVGARKATDYGKRVAADLGRQLAARGLVVVSGLAYGIDAAAHQGALDGGGATVAVLGCGLDIDYPAGNRKLRQRIRETGAVVSEYPPGTGPAAFRFPERNRIISGLSLGVVVVEAGERSGAVITALCAGEQNREVFAVPGRIDSPTSVGSHRLIQQGAKLVQRLEDILEELPPGVWQAALSRPEESAAVTDHAAARLLALLAVEARSVDSLAQESGLAARTVSGLLLQLELDGLVAGAGGLYRRLSPAGR